MHYNACRLPASRSREQESPWSAGHRGLHVEEISDGDDAGYDADIEVLQPDQYEDAEDSESTSDDENPEDHTKPESENSDSDICLVKRMEHLDCNPEDSRDFSKPDRTARGQKRRSTESETLHRHARNSRRPSHVELEVTELFQESDTRPPAKRRRRRSMRFRTELDRLSDSLRSTTDESERQGRPQVKGTSSSAPGLSPSLPANDAMEIS